MPQTRRQSLIESGTNIAVGLGLAYILNFTLLRWMDLPVSHAQNSIIAAAATVLSLARSYALRRCFNRWHR